MPGSLYPDDLAAAIKKSGDKKYRPSNGSEGEMFMEMWCYQCKKEKECQILTDAFCLGKDDDGYPKEWAYDEGQPCCTAFEPETKETT